MAWNSFAGSVASDIISTMLLGGILAVSYFYGSQVVDAFLIFLFVIWMFKSVGSKVLKFYSKDEFYEFVEEMKQVTGR